MSLKVLYKSGALGAGADIWILPSFDQTNWTKIINWCLNFQLSKSKTFQPKPPPPDFQELVAGKFSLKDYRAKPLAPLFICSSEFFPNQLVIKLAFKDEEFWIYRAYNIWRQLQRPTVRFFLPRTLAETDFESLWLALHPGVPMENITVVPGI